MTESCLLDTVETTLQTNLKALDAKCKSVQGGLQDDIIKGFQDIGTQISQMGKGLLGAKSQEIQITNPQPTTETARTGTIVDGEDSQPPVNDLERASSISHQPVQQDAPATTAQLDDCTPRQLFTSSSVCSWRRSAYIWLIFNILQVYSRIYSTVYNEAI